MADQNKSLSIFVSGSFHSIIWTKHFENKSCLIYSNTNTCLSSIVVVNCCLCINYHYLPKIMKIAVVEGIVICCAGIK